MHKNGLFSHNNFLLKKLLKSKEEWNFISNDKNISGKKFRLDLSFFFSDSGCVWSHLDFCILLLLLLLLLLSCWKILGN